MTTLRLLSTALALLLLTFAQAAHAQDTFSSGRTPSKGSQQGDAARCAEERLKHYADEPFKQPSVCPPESFDSTSDRDRSACAEAASKGIYRQGCDDRRKKDCAEAAAKGIRRAECEDVFKTETDCDQAAAKGIYRADCDPCARAAAKGFSRVDCDDAVKEADGPRPSPTPSMLTRAIADCLQNSGLSYFAAPRIAETRGGNVSYERASNTITYDPGFLQRQPPYMRAFWLGNAFGAHVLNLEKQRFGTTRAPLESLGVRNYLTGYITHCLVTNGVLARPVNNSPNDPRILYARYKRDGGFVLPGDAPRGADDLADWNDGWWDSGMGVAFSLRHDPKLRPTSGSPFGR